MTLFNKEMAEKAGNLVAGLFKDYLSEIEKAYLRMEDGKGFPVGFQVKLLPKGEAIKLDVDISFVAERVKDNAEGTVSRQMPLELKEEEPAFTDPPGRWPLRHSVRRRRT